MMPDAKDTDWTVAANEAKSEVLIFATWAGTHTVGDSPAGGGPTGKSTSTHFVYKLHFDSAGKIDSLTKVHRACPRRLCPRLYPPCNPAVTYCTRPRLYRCGTTPGAWRNWAGREMSIGSVSRGSVGRLGRS